MNKQYVVVGGSSGIGFELTKQLSEEGNRVVVLSRNEGDLDSLSNVTHVPHDVTSDTVPDLGLDTIDGFAYCPGPINLKPFHGLKPAHFLQDFEVNVMAVSYTHLTLPTNSAGEHPLVARQRF